MLKQIIYIEISSGFHIKQVTGIQRVVREITSEFCNQSDNFKYKVVPLVYNNRKKMYRKLNCNNILQRSFFNTNYISISELTNGSLFFDIDASWNNKLDREYLYNLLNIKKIKIINVHYDLVPLLKPQTVKRETTVRYKKYLRANLYYNNYFFCISSFVEHELKKYIWENYSKKIASSVIRLGTVLRPEKKQFFYNRYSFLKKKIYILSVGTIEPRKNHTIILEAFSKIKLDVSLVFIGKKGWNDKGFENKFNKFKKEGLNIYWYKRINDNELKFLYQNAYFSIYVSSYEGYGLPIAESLSYGIPVIAHSKGAIHEVGLNCIYNIDKISDNNVYKAMLHLLTEEIDYQENKENIKKNYFPKLWKDTINDILFGIKNWHPSP